ncbi:unnamed protein product [Ostreobium quekettii]|uniref:Uncharacterized protein n=1 Tax=Ostreobium quekettii TaxID=121088 RepID=A0A8S1JFV9_9CHLO|nr:unnamed protein product [Ostreobium quekettii]
MNEPRGGSWQCSRRWNAPGSWQGVVPATAAGNLKLVCVARCILSPVEAHAVDAWRRCLLNAALQQQAVACFERPVGDVVFCQVGTGLEQWSDRIGTFSMLAVGAARISVACSA